MKKPTKVLSVFSLVMINLIAVDSIRSLPISAEYGMALVGYYILAAILFMIPLALIAAELSTGWPQEGGIYVWVREAFGKKWGLFTAWIQWIYNVVWYPSILSLIAITILYIVDPSLINNRWVLLAIIIPLFWLATIMNCYGIRVASWISTISAIIGVLIPIAVITIMGIIWMVEKRPVAIPLNIGDIIPKITNFSNLGILTGLVFSLVGLEMSAIHASDVKNPQRDYPKALFISASIIIITMICGSLAIALVIPVKNLNLAAGLIEAFSLFFKAYGLPWLSPLIACAIVIGGFGGVSAWILGPSRCLMVASRDGAAPAFFAKVNRRGAPARILIMQAILFTLFCSAYIIFKNFNTAYWLLSAVTSQLALLLYAVVFLVAIRLRKTQPNQPRKFTIPGGKLGLWVVSLLGFLTCLGTFGLGFIPPSILKIQPTGLYETLLIGSILLLTIIPFFMYQCIHKAKNN